jgi:hypothetical protein
MQNIPFESLPNPIWKSFLQNCRFTWNSSGCKILSVNVTVEVAVKSQEASATIDHQ